ncbi:5-hydroxyisourate hydrolase [Paenibacillus phyllosphaerae]|uniref:5-hydroxyisourate hydrolase n=1 Tax=Paenibacillus phyllosphaerae TaxID=274593 RepID=A0A7W5ATI1_9BACL|nr:hydroxyisourate hydrolase [Paenibacillus phyllosphaerae]MBB3108483.1 5-hydroxyisourate hydrolase [Paenibacillus phyllosphaerae]
MSGRLTTHVLDMAAGGPAVGFRIELWQVPQADGGTGGTVLIKEIRTNDDGRADGPLLQGEELVPGVYELVFAAGEYFADRGVTALGESFLDQVPVRFRVADPNAHYHVPLLVAPGGYSTYRGS